MVGVVDVEFCLLSDPRKFGVRAASTNRRWCAVFDYNLCCYYGGSKFKF